MFMEERAGPVDVTLFFYFLARPNEEDKHISIISSYLDDDAGQESTIDLSVVIFPRVLRY